MFFQITNCPIIIEITSFKCHVVTITVCSNSSLRGRIMGISLSYRRCILQSQHLQSPRSGYALYFVYIYIRLAALQADHY
jgi:hypothetical protein